MAGSGSAGRVSEGCCGVEILPTATERVRVVSGVAVSYQFTTPRRQYWRYGTSSCSERDGDKSGRSELTTGSYTSDNSHPFSCS